MGARGVEKQRLMFADVIPEFLPEYGALNVTPPSGVIT